MKARFVFEQIRFNFEEPPYKRYVSRSGERGSQIPNPRKAGYGGLTPDEEDIVERHQLRIQDLQDEVYDLEGEIEGLQYELEQLSSQETPGEEVEEFYSQVQDEYGFGALDILNAGMNREQKIKAIDRLNPTQDFGEEEFENLVRDYEYYHPDDPDPDELKKLEDQITKLERQKQERENSIDKLETKIYNIETY